MNIKQMAKDFFSQTEFQTGEFKKYRAVKKQEQDGISFGSHYYNYSEILGNDPEYQLFLNAFHASFKEGKEWINVWAIPYDKLMSIKKKPISYIINWSYYNYVELDGLCFVFNHNRWDFKKKLQEYYPNLKIIQLGTM